MKFSRITEPWSPAPESRKQIEEAISCIAPDDAALTGWFQLYSRSQRKRLTLDVEHVGHWVRPGDRILEFGALPPILSVALTRAGYDVCGLDLKPERFQSTIDAERLNITKIDFEVETLPMRDGEYDVVIFNEVFEHLRINPIFTMREVHRVLKPEGILMLSTPNLTSWKGLVPFRVQGTACPGRLRRVREAGQAGSHGPRAHLFRRRGRLVSAPHRIRHRDRDPSRGIQVATQLGAAPGQRHPAPVPAPQDVLLGHREKAPSPAGLVDRRAAGGRDVKCALPRPTPR